MKFPLDTSGFKQLSFDLNNETLKPDERSQLETNIALYRDTIIFFTAVAGAKGVSGHSGGPYSIVPETLIAEAFMHGPNKVYPVCFDEAGHRVAIQYALAAFNGEMPFEKLLHYREADHGLYGHPELDPSLGIKFSSGRLGHMWPFINGVAKAHPDMKVVLLGSDGSQMEGNDAEAARLAVAYNLNVTLLIDNNNVTISGHPQDYLKGFDIERTLKGHGLSVTNGDPENIDDLYTRIRNALIQGGPQALVNTRKMAPGLGAIEGSHKGHDVVPVDAAVEYLEARGHTSAVEYLKGVSKLKGPSNYRGCSTETGSNRKEFGAVLADIVEEIPESERADRIMVIDSDLEGSTGLNTFGKRVPEVYVRGGVMERGNFSAAAGFGFEKGKQGVFSTFSAFIEMCVSEITMARLNESNVLSHFSHAGVDDIADNTCHYGINVFFADSGVNEMSENSRLYFPADTHQLRAIVRRVFDDPGLRFVFSTRSTVPYVLTEDGDKHFFSEEAGYKFEPGKDEIVRKGTAGYIVSYGEMLHRAMDAVVGLKEAGIDVGLINKPTLNVVDEETMKMLGDSPAVLLVEAQNSRTGLGTRFGTWLLQRGLTPRYSYMGTHRQGAGGLSEHILHQGLGTEDIRREFQKLVK
ncbi:MAG: transketolase C-terminal domain-containing protein [Spirochaetota bacterium]